MTQTVNAAGTYYLGARDSAGNFNVTSITIVSYSVQGYLETVDGTTDTYTSANYVATDGAGTSIASKTYIVAQNTELTLSNIYDIPTGAVAGTYKGYTTLAPSTTARTLTTGASTKVKVATTGTIYYTWFNRSTFALTLNKDASSIMRVIGAGTYKYGKTVSISAEAHTGYAFSKWTVTSGNTPANINSASTTVTITQATTLTASATKNTYAIKIDPNGGTLNGSTSITTKNIAYGSTVAPGTPTKTGYTFGGWIPVKTAGTDNATFAEVFYHNNNAGTTLFASDTEAQSANTVDKYSILGQLEKFRANTSAELEFMLNYDTISGTNRWKQTSNPTTTSESITGYSAVGTLSWTVNSWGGMAKSSSNSSTFIDGSPSSGDWYYAIGAKTAWSGGIPGPSLAEKHGVSLWLKCNSDLSNINTAVTGVTDSSGNYIARHNVTLKAVWIPNTYNLVRVTDTNNILTNGDFENYSVVDAPTGTGNGLTHTWNQELNGIPGNTSKAYRASGWGTGCNMGVDLPEVGYHAHMREVNGNMVFRYKTNEAFNGQNTLTESNSSYAGQTSVTKGTVTTYRWLGIAQGIAGSSLTAGKTYTITMDVYRVSGTTYPRAGIYHTTTSNTSERDFHSGLGNLVPTTTGKWETLSYTFTLASNYSTAIQPAIYIYGYHGGTGELYVDNVRLQEVTPVNKTYNANYTATELVAPTREGYEFIGWYADATYTKPITTSSAFNTTTATFSDAGLGRGTNAYVYAKWRLEYLAELAKVGDYVNYDANSNGTYTKTGEIMAGVTIDDNQTFTTAESVKWRILSIDSATQKVTLMAEDPILKTGSTTNYKNVTLSRVNGYKNTEEGLDELGKIYGHGKGAESGRSINIDDIMQYSNFDPATQYRNSSSSNGTVGGTVTYTSGNFITGETYNGESVVKVPEGVTVTNNSNGTISASTVTVTQTYYHTKDEATTRASFTGARVS